MEGTGIVEETRRELEPHLVVPTTPASANWFYVMYEMSGCKQNEDGMHTEFKAFETKEDAMKFYKWHQLIGNGVALYDWGMHRLDFTADCGYKPSFFDR